MRRLPTTAVIQMTPNDVDCATMGHGKSAGCSAVAPDDAVDVAITLFGWLLLVAAALVVALPPPSCY